MHSSNNNIRSLIDSYFNGTLSFEETEELLHLLEEDPSVIDSLLTDALPSVESDELRYPNKSKLLKSYSDLSQEQYEYLCIASAEGDLTEDQARELEEYSASRDKNDHTLSIYKKLKLKAEEVTYSKKATLRKSAPLTKTIRMVTVALSAAASVALFFMAFNYFSGEKLPRTIAVSEPVRQNATTQQGIREPQDLSGKATVTDEIDLDNHESTEVVAVALNVITKDSIVPAHEKEVPDRSLSVAPLSGTHATIHIAANTITEGLAEVFTGEPVPYHGPLSLKDHLAIAFRERFMDKEFPDASPIKAYEVASVGITGLNKILGWEMDFEVRKEEKGEVNALAFNSRLIKFETPVKKAIHTE